MNNPSPDRVIVAFRGEAKRKGFTQIPNVVLFDLTLSAPARILYGALVSYAINKTEGFVTSQKDIANDLGCTDRSIRNWMDELEAKKLVTVIRRGLNVPNVYMLEDAYALYDQQKPATKERKAGSGQKRNGDSPTERKNGSGQGGKPVPPLKESENKELREEKVPPSAAFKETLAQLRELDRVGAKTWRAP